MYQAYQNCCANCAAPCSLANIQTIVSGQDFILKVGATTHRLVADEAEVSCASVGVSTTTKMHPDVQHMTHDTDAYLSLQHTHTQTDTHTHTHILTHSLSLPLKRARSSKGLSKRHLLWISTDAPSQFSGSAAGEKKPTRFNEENHMTGRL